MKPNEMTEEHQIKYVQKYYRNIGNIINQYERVQLAAVKANLLAILYIKNPTENVQLYVVKKHGWYIKYIIKKLRKNPSTEVQKAAIDDNCLAIKFIINPDEEIQKIALNNKFLIKQILNKKYFKKISYRHLMKWID